MDEADFLDRMQRVAEAFRPAAPVDRRDLFAGRSQQIADVFSIVWRKALGEIGFGTARQAIGFAERIDETTQPLSRLLGPSDSRISGCRRLG